MWAVIHWIYIYIFMLPSRNTVHYRHFRWLLLLFITIYFIMWKYSKEFHTFYLWSSLFLCDSFMLPSSKVMNPLKSRLGPNWMYIFSLFKLSFQDSVYSYILLYIFGKITILHYCYFIISLGWVCGVYIIMIRSLEVWRIQFQLSATIHV